MIAADGLGSRLLSREPGFRETIAAHSRIGVGAMLPAGAAGLARFEAGTIHMSVADGGYVGLARVEAGRFDVGAALDPDFIRDRGGIGPAVAAVLESAGHGRLAALECARWRGTPALTRRRRPLAAARVLIVGDAAGYIEPFTGEGMAWALAGGLGVADAALEGAAAWSRRVTTRWEAAHARLVRSRQTICRGLSYVVRRERLRGICLQLLSPFPRLAAPIVARLNADFAHFPGVRKEPVS